MTKIQLKHIRKSYGDVEVIHGINLDIASGEFCVFVGPVRLWKVNTFAYYCRA